MKVTVLVENTAPQDSGLTPEHGLSLYIQYREHKDRKSTRLNSSH